MVLCLPLLFVFFRRERREEKKEKEEASVQHIHGPHKVETALTFMIMIPYPTLVFSSPTSVLSHADHCIGIISY